MTIYLRQQRYLDAIAEAKDAKRKRFPDASAKQRAAKPSKKSKLKRLAAKAIREKRGREL